jgi:predicted molibdopterin-dependent oxidoreductase YjgC
VDTKGLVVNRHTLAVEDAEGVFAAGGCVHATRMAVRAVADANVAAASLCAWLGDAPACGIVRRFNSRTAALTETELQECMQEGDAIGRRTADAADGFSDADAIAESGRCLHCDCRDKAQCRLRALAEEYGARQRRYPIDERPTLSKALFGQRLIMEPGKCIKCGRCVRICEAAGVREGLAFLDRGLEVRVAVPFGGDLAAAPDNVLAECIRACPTGALSL